MRPAARITIIWAILAMLLSLPASPQDEPSDLPEPQISALAVQLDGLAGKGFAAPVVAVLAPARADSEAETPQGEPGSLKELARMHGLALFEQDGVSVIGPAGRADYSRVFNAGDLWSKDMLSLVTSLSNSQVRMLCSSQGLPYTMLNEHQRVILAANFSEGGRVMTDDPELAKQIAPLGSIPAESIRLQSCRLTAWLSIRGVVLRHGPEEWQTQLVWGGSEPKGWRLVAPPDPAREELESDKPVPNVLKESQLDYAQKSLQVPISLKGRTSLRDLIDLASKNTGLDLRASPGSEKVFLYVSASDVPAGRLLEAVSLATTGTWREFGDKHIFAPDLTGLGQIAAAKEGLANRLLLEWAMLGTRVRGCFSDPMLLGSMPYAPDTLFTLRPEQFRILLRSDAARLPWNMLTSEQRAFILKQIAEGDGEASRQTNRQRESWTVGLSASIYVSAVFPDREPIILPVEQLRYAAFGGFVAPTNELGITIIPVPGDEETDWFAANAPIGLRIPLDEPMRGYMCKPSARETPDELISVMEKHRLNTLFLRVFSDGYTAFPSREFPLMPRLGADYLKQAVSLAHEKGIKVYGVLDVLRWSDGTAKHWVTRRPELLDYDIMARSRTQFSRELSDWLSQASDLLPVSRLLMPEEFGEGLTGDAVSPYNPEVGGKLRGMLEELAKCDLDGLALDFTTMRHTAPDSYLDSAYRAGRPGHGPIARGEFFRLYGADSVDIQAGGVDSWDSPMQPVIDAYTKLQVPWDEFYRRGCDSLLDGLIRKWREIHGAASPPVWDIVTFRAGRQSHDWPRFKDLLDGVIISGTDFPGTGGTYYGLKSVPIVRAADGMGTLRFATVLATGLDQEFDGMSPDLARKTPWITEGVVLDMTCADRSKANYLRLVRPATSKD